MQQFQASDYYNFWDMAFWILITWPAWTISHGSTLVTKLNLYLFVWLSFCQRFGIHIVCPSECSVISTYLYKLKFAGFSDTPNWVNTPRAWIACPSCRSWAACSATYLFRTCLPWERGVLKGSWSLADTSRKGVFTVWIILINNWLEKQLKVYILACRLRKLSVTASNCNTKQCFTASNSSQINEPPAAQFVDISPTVLCWQGGPAQL